MEITQIKFEFTPLPFLRKTDTITKGASKIIISTANKSYVDVTAMHYEAQNSGKSGFPYHYVIKKGGSDDGAIIYARPKIYQNGINPGAGDKNVINNSISILLGGLDSEPLSDAQKTSLSKLCAFLVDQENMTADSVTFEHELTNTTLSSNNWFEIKTGISTLISLRTPHKTISSPESIMGVKTNSAYDQIITTAMLNTINKIKGVTGVPESTIISMNRQLPNAPTLRPNEVVYIPKAQYSLMTTAQQQRSVAAYLVTKTEEDIKIKVVENEKYKAGVAAGTIADAYDIDVLSTKYGGKKEPDWYRTGMELPGYHNAYIHFTSRVDNSTDTIKFLMSPSSFTDSRQITQQMAKTTAGWFIMRTGRAPYSVNLSGYVLDIKSQLERHDLLEKYKKYVEDRRNEKFEYFYEYSTKVVVEGREYFGYIQSISFSKSAIQPFLYQYNIGFVILNERKIYNPAYAAQSVLSLQSAMKADSTKLNNIAVDTKYVTMPDSLFTKLSTGQNVPTVETQKGYYTTVDAVALLRKTEKNYVSDTYA